MYAYSYRHALRTESGSSGDDQSNASRRTPSSASHAAITVRRRFVVVSSSSSTCAFCYDIPMTIKHAHIIRIRVHTIQAACSPATLLAQSGALSLASLRLHTLYVAEFCIAVVFYVFWFVTLHSRFIVQPTGVFCRCLCNRFTFLVRRRVVAPPPPTHARPHRIIDVGPMIYSLDASHNLLHSGLPSFVRSFVRSRCRKFDTFVLCCAQSRLQTAVVTNDASRLSSGATATTTTSTTTSTSTSTTTTMFIESDSTDSSEQPSKDGMHNQKWSKTNHLENIEMTPTIRIVCCVCVCVCDV